MYRIFDYIFDYSDSSVNYEDCCLTYMKKMRSRSKKHAVGYRLQITDGSCNIPAVMLVHTDKNNLNFKTVLIKLLMS